MHLTKEQRMEIKFSMNKEQLNVLFEYHRYTVSSHFHTELLLENTDWEFVDYIVSNDESEVLYCECGRRLKYQYIIQSKKNKEIKKLGINHFVQHLGIPSSIANQVKAGMHRIDYWLDEILCNYKDNEFLRQRETIKRYLDISIGETKEDQMIRAFFEVGLPLQRQKYTKIARIVRENDLIKINKENFIDIEKRKSKVLNHMFHVMEKRFRHVAIGECLDYFEILNYLGPNNTDKSVVKCDEVLIDKIVQHFEINTEMKLRILNERVYRIK